MSEKATEQASEHAKKKARDRGDKVRSRELVSAFALLAGVVSVGRLSPDLLTAWRLILDYSVAAACRPGLFVDVDTKQSARLVLVLLRPTLMRVGVIMFASFAGALVVGVVQGGGLSVQFDVLMPKWNRIDPAKNLANLFKVRSVARLAKSILPGSAMVFAGGLSARSSVLSQHPVSLVALPAALSGSYRIVLQAALITVVWSGFDYASEWFAWQSRMKMTKQQLRDEMKETEGNPQNKRRMRMLQHGRRRVANAPLSRANVVVTNPTHYAVALEFSFETMSAPVVLAKGRDLQAKKMREEARWEGVPIVENPPLARSLYKTVETGRPIPFELYAAVATILAFLYRQAVEDKMRN